MKHSISLFIILLAITFHSCDLFTMDKEPTLPEISAEGKGTFGCVIDGELFLPKGPDHTGGMGGNPHANYTEVSGTCRLAAQNTDSWTFALSGSTAIFSEGEYDIRYTSTVSNLLIDSCSGYQVDTTNAILTISYLDTDLDIISGIFSGNFINECDSTKIIQITDGRFDLVYTL